MIAIIMAAGLGTRLKEEVKDKPKCMVDVGGKPVLERIANHLENNGIRQIVVNLHSFPEVVMKHFGQRFMYLYEPVPMGEFNTVNLVKGWFPGEDILVVNGDTITDFWPFFKPQKKHNGFTVYGKDITKYYDDDFIDIGTPDGLKLAREKYDRNKKA